MKCKCCNTEIEQDAQFCPNCGKDLSKFDKCVNCGELLDNDTVFCPHCGAEQPRKEPKETASSKKWLWGVVGLFLIGLVGGGYYYLSQNRDSSSQLAEAVDTDSIEVLDAEHDIHSVEGIKERLGEILKNSLGMDDEAVVKNYFSQEFRKLFSEVDEIDSKLDGLGFWNGNIWDGGQDGNPNSFTINSVKGSSDTNTHAEVKFTYSQGDYYSENLISVDLVFEKGTWFIDNIDGNKNRMKEYIKENANEKGSSIIFAGKIYKGNGNGGGLATKMAITFLDNKKCLCESDWYQAFSTPKAIQGTYSIDGDKLFVRCKVDDIDYDFEFDVKADGRKLEFDNSDPDMEGTMGRDYMSLELQN